MLAEPGSGVSLRFFHQRFHFGFPERPESILIGAQRANFFWVRDLGPQRSSSYNILLEYLTSERVLHLGVQIGSYMSGVNAILTDLMVVWGMFAVYRLVCSFFLWNA